MRGIFIVLGSLLASSAGAASVDRTVDLDRVGLNMSLAAEANGDLHLVWRGATGDNPAQFGEICYRRSTAADDTCHFPSLVVLQESGTPRMRVSADIDTNQPRVSADPAAPGRAWILCAGDFRQDIQPTLA